ncbi:hypothetical protein [Cerasicoccus frondis]|uniref:hypothetical protein n=1 Tax=Cerasicoccus frondis TaxID=490090 RepID=UPI0028529CE5|nr:hypothetical protein [Cerasicoccus frondis]
MKTNVDFETTNNANARECHEAGVDLGPKAVGQLVKVWKFVYDVDSWHGCRLFTDYEQALEALYESRQSFGYRGAKDRDVMDAWWESDEAKRDTCDMAYLEEDKIFIDQSAVLAALKQLLPEVQEEIEMRRLGGDDPEYLRLFKPMQDAYDHCVAVVKEAEGGER